MKAVILAGGKGARLRPYTTHFPKPLMPVGDKPIIEILINRLRDSGITDMIITVGHLGELLRAFLKDGKHLGVNIQYSSEETPLGTAGPLNQLKDDLSEDFLLINGDILTDINYQDLIKEHRESGAAGTIALTRRSVYIDFGVVEVDGTGAISAWKEKPSLDYLVSMGIYLFQKRALDHLPEGRIDLPDFLSILMSGGERIHGYIFDGYWLDIGRPEDYEKACGEHE